MPDDLVKRLRELDRLHSYADKCEAASRIEMLEAALQRANATAEEYERKFYLGSDRIEQLEAALREIINKDSFSMDWAIRTARKALEVKDE